MLGVGVMVAMIGRRAVGVTAGRLWDFEAQKTYPLREGFLDGDHRLRKLQVLLREKAFVEGFQVNFR